MNIEGTIKKIEATKEYGEKGFKKREAVIETQGEYPQPILVEFVQDKCAILDKFAVGDSVVVDINLRGREWTAPDGQVRYFNSIQGWKITKNTGEAKPVGKKDDLPF
jgi:hypothetical protein